MPTHDYFLVKAKCGALVSEALKLLLETKHLYQYSPITPFTEVIDEMLPDTSEHGALRKNIAESILGRWYVVESNYNSQLPPPGTYKSGAGHMTFVASRVRLYCNTCKGPELHDCTDTHNDQTTFFLVYSCLNCRKGRISFLVERERTKDGERLRLSGRNPIEHLPVPPSIPPFLASHYSNAMIAFSCGFVGMGIFGLRTVIEQWARAVTRITIKIEGADLFDKYSALLPPGFSSIYPSLGALYSGLSADMHSATGDATLFDRARKEIENHFSALRSLPNPNSAISGALSRKTT